MPSQSLLLLTLMLLSHYTNLFIISEWDLHFDTLVLSPNYYHFFFLPGTYPFYCPKHVKIILWGPGQELPSWWNFPLLLLPNRINCFLFWLPWDVCPSLSTTVHMGIAVFTNIHQFTNILWEIFCHTFQTYLPSVWHTEWEWKICDDYKIQYITSVLFMYTNHNTYLDIVAHIKHIMCAYIYMYNCICI